MGSPVKYSLLFLIGLALLAGGCTTKSPAVVYYTLTLSGNAAGEVKARPQEGIAIGIGPVKFPGELNRPSIVTRSGRNRLVIDEFHRWGGSLEDDFLRVIAGNLTNLLQTEKVMVRPWESFFQPDVRISFDVHRFDGRLGESALLKVTWMVFREDGDKGVVGQSDLSEPVSGDGYDRLVEAQSRLVERLSEEIAKVVKEI